jgi:hypothetical protein
MSGFSKDYENYAFTNLFKKELFPKINEWVGDKLINLGNTLISHQYGKMNEIFNTNFIYNYMSVGGILGGNIKHLKEFLNVFDFLGDEVLKNDYIINHEALISHIEKIHPEYFKTYKFDTWYHEDYWKCTPYFDRDSIKGFVHFTHFFEKELGL